MKLYSPLGTLLVTILLLLTAISSSDSPPANTIPIISMKTGQSETSLDITLDVICNLLWHNFDGIWVEGWINSTGYQYNPAVLSDSVGAFVVLAPSRLQALNNIPDERWARYTPALLQASNAFIHPNSNFSSIASTAYATDMIANITDRCSLLAGDVSNLECVWYYDIFNEGPAKQLNRMNDSDYVYDDYFPNMYTQDTLLNRIDSTGVFSWVKWKSDSIYNADSVYCPSVSVCFSSIHYIAPNEWGGCEPGVDGGTLHQQANSVRAYFSTKYLEYDSSGSYDIYDNFPERMDLNSYPVRFAGYTWQTEEPESISVLGSATDLWMLEHYEEILDSTFIAASSGPFPINYHVQSFGRTGGRAIWKITQNPPPKPPDTTINYAPYSYRIPSPGEFRMLCNIGLLRGAKGVFPFTIRSYQRWDNDTLLRHNTGLLDEDLIPFDAPYEDWVYRERPVNDYNYAPPDSIPPWTAADGSQFDPLYSVPSRPTIIINSERNKERYLLWKFAVYARLWNSAKKTFGDIARVAPELSGLWWWYDDDNYDKADISYNGLIIHDYFATPEIKVFTDSTATDCYLYYMNRFCRANNIPFEITIDSRDFDPTNINISEYALDHSRRVLVEGSFAIPSAYTFLDTLDAGEARLLQMFDDDDGLDADVRITDPDLFVVLAADSDTLSNYSSYDSVAVDVVARFYNMGTESLDSIEVYLTNLTTDELIAKDTISFSGLSTDSCYKPDVATAIFSWTPGYDDIGANILEVSTQIIANEPDPSDNSATLVYLVKPIDYATKVLDDPWDMTEATTNKPDWYTNDIDSLTGCWDNSAFTDSVSGMFEGALTNPTYSNGMYLNTGSGSSDYIDANRYINLSLAGMSETRTLITVHWLDSQDSTGYITLTTASDTLRAVAADLGPWDLSELSGSWTGDIKKLWLVFNGAGNLSTDIRIGWVKLTE